MCSLTSPNALFFIMYALIERSLGNVKSVMTLLFPTSALGRDIRGERCTHGTNGGLGNGPTKAPVSVSVDINLSIWSGKRVVLGWFRTSSVGKTGPR